MVNGVEPRNPKSDPFYSYLFVLFVGKKQAEQSQKKSYYIRNHITFLADFVNCKDYEVYISLSKTL